MLCQINLLSARKLCSEESEILIIIESKRFKKVRKYKKLSNDQLKRIQSGENIDGDFYPKAGASYMLCPKHYWWWKNIC